METVSPRPLFACDVTRDPEAGPDPAGMAGQKQAFSPTAAGCTLAQPLRLGAGGAGRGGVDLYPPQKTTAL